MSTHSRPRAIQHNIVIRPDTARGHVSARVPGSRDEMLRALDTRLASAAGESVLLVDSDRIASASGKFRWFDDRYWHLAMQAVAMEALPTLARHTDAVLAAAEGLSACAWCSISKHALGRCARRGRRRRQRHEDPVVVKDEVGDLARTDPQGNPDRAHPDARPRVDPTYPR